jgi:hypothetical protein
MPSPDADLDLVSLGDIADRLAVPTGTVYAWRARGRLPEPGWVVSGGTPIWLWASIHEWAAENGYTPAPDRWEGWGVDGTGIVHGRSAYGIAVARNLGTRRLLFLFGQPPADPRAPLTIMGERALIALSRFTPFGLPPHTDLAQDYETVIADSGVEPLITIRDVPVE